MKENVVEYNLKFMNNTWEYFKKYNIDKVIRDVMKDYFEPKGQWGEVNGKRIGVMNMGYDLSKIRFNRVVAEFVEEILGGRDPKRSLLNYLDTNKIAIFNLLNWVNSQIVKGEIKNTQVDFYLGKWETEIRKFFEILFENKDKIFSKDSTIIYDILRIIVYTSYNGNKAEIETINRIKKFPNVSNIQHAEFGDVDDMFGGIDISFEYDEKIFTIQSKKYQNMKEDDNFYYFYGVGEAKIYSVNIYSFYNEEFGFYMFRNGKGIQVRPDTYIIPKGLKYKNV
jgi:hypothetical protein